MYSEKFKNDLVKLCFDEQCNSFAKETSGLKAITSAIVQQKGILNYEEKIFICKKDSKIEIDYFYSGKIDKEKVRFHVLKKLNLPYMFKVNFEGEDIYLECDQYEIA